MQIAEFNIDLEPKAIKNIHLAVYPPTGRIHVSYPKYMKQDDISVFLYSKLPWIREKWKAVQSQERQPKRQYISGENHYLFGQRNLLEVVPTNGCFHVEKNVGTLTLYAHRTTSVANKKAVLNEFYREQLHSVLIDFVERWRVIMDEDQRPVSWNILAMRRLWGSCGTISRSMRFNLYLARVPKRCIEYVVVHELAHLKEHSHNEHFRSILTQYLPDWQQRKKELDDFVAFPIED